MIMREILYFGIISTVFIMACSGDKPDVAPDQKVTEIDPVAISKSNPTKIYAHYMVWYENKETSGDGKWGQHWTMSTRNPDISDANGKRQIASHFYPAVGPYASRDKDVIEYHLLLMKYSGIDGIIIDWYGIHDVNDYASIKTNTEAVVDMLDEAGLEFAIAYEDRTLASVVSSGTASSKVDAAINDMNYLKNKFFSNSQYIKISQQPLLMVFGPIELQTESEWTTVFGALNPKPKFLTLWNESGDAGVNASGEYSWVYKNNSYLDNFYNNRLNSLNLAMGSAYPGFMDFYQQGGWGQSLGWTIDHRDGATLDETLLKARNAGVNYLQLVTWNDFGEGTIIEPTFEFGNSYLEKVQLFAGVNGYTNVFGKIKNQFDLRKKLKSNSSAQKSLGQAFYYFVSMQSDKAITTIDSLQTKYP